MPSSTALENEKADDSLSRYPSPHDEVVTDEPPRVFASTTLVRDRDLDSSQDHLSDRQRADPELEEIIRYLEEGTLPTDDKKARLLVLNKPQYTMVDQILYHLAADKTLRIVPPQANRRTLFEGVHKRRVWWPLEGREGAWDA